MLHLLPLHPEAQEHVFGPTHFPLFIHMGSHTPETHSVIIFPFSSTQSKFKLKKKPTFLTPLSSVSFRTGAHVVSHALTPVFTGRTAHSCNT